MLENEINEMQRPSSSCNSSIIDTEVTNQNEERPPNSKNVQNPIERNTYENNGFQSTADL